MRIVASVLLVLFGLVAQAAAGDYTYANRPEVVFKGGPVHISPYPAGKRAAAVWASDACWRDCKTSCTWKFEYCVRGSDADICRPHLDSCDRACLSSCRTRGGPFVGLFDGLFE
jgi:hypothetical protein